MIAKLVLDKKREGHALGSAEIREFIEGFTRGAVPDYQMSALAMAICCRGMNERETADLTDAMMRSGACLEWSGLSVPTADKHSTGGVGDKLSLVVQPLAAACGVAVPSLTGRGLGITGGTADKLETIPGYSCSLSLDAFRAVVADVGVSMTVQTEEICPADKKLYALRDVTGTVASIPLITGSILSKKLAEGAGTLVFDVKCGKGAFMKTLDEARALARSLVSGAKAAGRRSAALVTRMDAPLGRCVGNANEVAEAIEMLECRKDGAELRRESVDLCVELAALMVSLAREIALEDAREECRARLADGSALARFRSMVEAHGGDLGRFADLRTRPTFKFAIQAMRSGHVESIDAEKVARVALSLGAGREKAGDRIDPLAGVTLAVGVGDKVTTGQQLATLERSSDPDGLEPAAAELYRAFRISSSAPERTPLILERIPELALA
ncbi:MAG: thymidine phosphorylase [Kiritimatiellae bacterium]|nr:thymidine phosphorylase [Kiritimatiellia bacterium]